ASYWHQELGFFESYDGRRSTPWSSRASRSGKKIREVERLLAQARLENFHDVNRDDEGSEGSDIDSTESNNEEDENLWVLTDPIKISVLGRAVITLLKTSV
ncbi:hypothetical protein Tco_0387645, partial [Tanacetum coccineum]